MVYSAAVMSALTMIAVTYFFLVRAGASDALHRLTVWVIFGVLLSLSPILFSLIFYFLTDKPDYVQVISRGELFIISVALGASAAGNLIATGSEYRTLKAVSAGGSLLLVIISALLFAAVSGAGSPNINDDRVAETSLVILLLTIAASGGCVILAEKQ